MKSKVSIVRCNTYKQDEIFESVKKAVDLIGGMSNFVRPGQKVLIKPNLLSARLPEEGVDTHPEFVRAVVKLVKEAGGVVYIGDSPGGWFVKNPDEVYSKCGIKEVAEQENVNLVKFDNTYYIDGIPFATYAKDCSCIISLPKMKTHNLTTLTGAVKNTFGMVVGLYKANCHLRAPKPYEFSNLLVDIFSYVKPHLSIMDGIVSMDGDGPAAGRLRDSKLILASHDAVSLDAVFSKIVGLEPFKLHTTQIAHKKGLGCGDLNQIEILGESLEDVKISDFKLPQAAFFYKLPSSVLKLSKKVIWIKPYIIPDVCTKCDICVKTCPVKAINLKKDILVVDNKRCIDCFCCHEVCQYNAIKINRSLLTKFIAG